MVLAKSVEYIHFQLFVSFHFFVIKQFLTLGRCFVHTHWRCQYYYSINLNKHCVHANFGLRRMSGKGYSHVVSTEPSNNVNQLVFLSVLIYLYFSIKRVFMIVQLEVIRWNM